VNKQVRKKAGGNSRRPFVCPVEGCEEHHRKNTLVGAKPSRAGRAAPAEHPGFLPDIKPPPGVDGEDDENAPPTRRDNPKE